MRRFTLPAFAILAGLLLAASLHAETKVTISKTHLCCPQCLTGVEAALKDVAGVKHKCSQQAKTIELTADSDEAAQKAIDALAKAGFYGATDSETIKYKLAEAPKGDVERLEIVGAHNCCGACTQAIKKALGTVDGITANTVKAKSDSFVLEGKFSAEKAIQALLDAGFCAQVKK
jgi:periplasmic mercuric ion binding protein